MMQNNNLIAVNYEKILDEISVAANNVSRDPKKIKIVAVTKTKSIKVIEELYNLGIRDFGENRIEEAINKIISFSNTTGVKWHMIGHVQSRKAEIVSENFDLLHSLDSLKLANRLNRFAFDKNKTLPVLLQINVSGELSKSGWQAEDDKKWDELIPDIESVLNLANIEVRGLMTMAPYGIDPEQTRPVFARLRKLRDRLAKKYPASNWKELSMGMSSDYKIAVQEGASILRIGSRIFENQ